MYLSILRMNTKDQLENPQTHQPRKGGAQRESRVSHPARSSKRIDTKPVSFPTRNRGKGKRIVWIGRESPEHLL